MIETAVGTCKYCGQTCTVEVEEGCSQEQVDEVVTSKCLCEEAKEMRKCKGQMSIEDFPEVMPRHDTVHGQI